MRNGPADNSSHLQRFIGVAETMATLAKVVASLDSAGLRIDRQAGHPFAGRARIKIDGRPWALTATGNLERGDVEVVLYRRGPRGWLDDTFSVQALMELEHTFQLNLVATPGVVGVMTGIPFFWNYDDIDQRLEMMMDAVKGLWADVGGGA